MHTGIHDKLIRVAKNQDVVNYSDVAPLAGLAMDYAEDRGRIADILDCISETEHRGRETTVVCGRNPERHEHAWWQGFFSLATRLGLHGTGDDDFKYWFQELRRVHDYWRTSA